MPPRSRALNHLRLKEADDRFGQRVDSASALIVGIAAAADGGTSKSLKLSQAHTRCDGPLNPSCVPRSLWCMRTLPAQGLPHLLWPVDLVVLIPDLPDRACRLVVALRPCGSFRRIQLLCLMEEVGRAVYDIQCGANSFESTRISARCATHLFTAGGYLMSNCSLAMSRSVAHGEAMRRIYELPLTTWTDVSGSIVKVWHGFRADRVNCMRRGQPVSVRSGHRLRKSP
jgi:hypothetical protein